MNTTTIPALIAAFTAANPDTARIIFEGCSPALLKLIESPAEDCLVRQAPVLDCDGGTRNDLNINGKIERRIVWNLLNTLAAAGFNVWGVDDGDGLNKSVRLDARAAMEAIFAVDDAWLYVKKPGRGNSEHGIKLVGGNGEEIISDWTYSTDDKDGFNAFMQGFKAEDNY